MLKTLAICLITVVVTFTVYQMIIGPYCGLPTLDVPTLLATLHLPDLSSITTIVTLIQQNWAAIAGILSLVSIAGGFLYSQLSKAKAQAAQDLANTQILEASNYVGTVTTEKNLLTEQLGHAQDQIAKLELQVGNTSELLNKIEALGGDKQELLLKNEMLASIMPSKAKVEELLTWKEQQEKVH